MKSGFSKTEDTLFERFASKVQVTETCWNWVSKSKTEFGYGRLFLKGKGPERAHRVSWMIFNGEIPANMCVLHKCDNPGCVNPDHLFLGTHMDNTQDKMRKKRHLYGNNNYLTKFSESLINKVRKLYSPGSVITKKEAGKYKMSARQLRDIINYKTRRLG